MATQGTDLDNLKALCRDYIREVINNHDVSALDKFMDSNVIDHNPIPGVPPGIQGMKQQHDQLFQSFPDVQAQVEFEIAEGDMCVVRIRNSGTHRGEFQGIAPTGNSFDNHEVHIMKVKDGKIVEHWAHIDGLQLAQQLDLLPKNAPPGQTLVPGQPRALGDLTWPREAARP